MVHEKGTMKVARIQDVAREAGVSAATVSYVLNQKGNIAPETRERVLKVAERLNYRPNAAGRTLSSNRTMAIGLVTPRGRGVTDPFYSLVVSGITEEAAKFGYHIVLIPGESSEEELLREVQNRLVDGVFFLEVDPDDERMRLVKSNGVPVTLFGTADILVDLVDIDNYRGAWMATAHLLELGHRRIVFAAPLADRVGRLRMRGYEDCVRARDNDAIPAVEDAPMTRDGGYQLGKRILKSSPRPTAVFAASDAMADGFMQAALEFGIKIPHELSIVGFDDIPVASQLAVPLTTISQNAAGVGRQMARQMMEQLADGIARNQILLPELIVRESTGPVPSSRHAPLVTQHFSLKSGTSFSLWSLSGMVEPDEPNLGIFLNDTHWLSTYQIRVNSQPIMPALASATTDSFTMRYIVAANLGTIDFSRTLTFADSHLIDTWHWTAWDITEPWTLEVRATPDFRDIFELRGFQASSRGTRRSELHEDGSERHVYTGKDGLFREVGLSYEPSPTDNELGTKRWNISPEQKTGTVTARVSWTVAPGNRGNLPTKPNILWPKVDVENGVWQRVLDRAELDLRLLSSDLGFGPILVAGLPWFGTLFGRDSIMAAMQVIEFYPEFAENTLATLAHFQGKVVDPTRGEMPGKIVHEVRFGELANTGAVPFGRYYGSVDATPLYIVLLEATWRRTGNKQLLHRFLPVAQRALQWIQDMLDKNGSGLLVFEDEPSNGLVVQSWKDSADSMVYGDGRQATPPLAVAEVQGYVYQALLAMANMYDQVGNAHEAAQLRQQADTIQARFHTEFWIEHLKYYAMATDHHGSQLDVLSSDAGHCLWTGIIREPYRGQVVEKVMGDDLFSGWGVRTLGSQERAYNPYSYHRGSVWPHDTSIICAGLAKTGYQEECTTLVKSLVDAADGFPEHRLPELFSGVTRRDDDHVPLPYPSACSPQAWASGALWLGLSSLLGLSIDVTRKTVRLQPVPTIVGTVHISNLMVDEYRITVEATSSSVSIRGLPEDWIVVSPSSANADGDNQYI